MKITRVQLKDIICNVTRNEDFGLILLNYNQQKERIYHEEEERIEEEEEEEEFITSLILHSMKGKNIIYYGLLINFVV